MYYKIRRWLTQVIEVRAWCELQAGDRCRLTGNHETVVVINDGLVERLTDLRDLDVREHAVKHCIELVHDATGPAACTQH